MVITEEHHAQLPASKHGVAALLTLETAVPKEKLKSVLSYSGFPLSAAHVVKLSMDSPRVAPNPMETRAALVAWDEANGRYGVRIPNQGAFAIGAGLATVLGIAFGWLFGAEPRMLMSMAPKSVTSPIARIGWSAIWVPTPCNMPAKACATSAANQTCSARHA
mgnify:CR=1 FL=1